MLIFFNRRAAFCRFDSSVKLFKSGPVAQLGERLNGIQEVVGSIPIGSTSNHIQIAVLRPETQTSSLREAGFFCSAYWQDVPKHEITRQNTRCFFSALPAGSIPPDKGQIMKNKVIASLLTIALAGVHGCSSSTAYKNAQTQPIVTEQHTTPSFKKLEGHSGPVLSIAYSPDGKRIVSSDFDNAVKVWDAQTGEELQTFAHTDSVYGVSFSPDGKTVASASRDGKAKLWNAETGEEIQQFIHSGQVMSVDYHPNGKTIATGSRNGTVMLWDTESGLPLSRLTHSQVLSSVSFSPDGKHLAAGGRDMVRLWNTETNDELEQFEHSLITFAVAYSPDGKSVASGSSENTIKLWDVKTGKERKTLAGHTKSVCGLAFSPNGKKVASGSPDGTIRLWDAQTGHLLQTISAESGHVNAVAFSPDGKTLASGSLGTVQLWDLVANNN